jgi:hypothetical protein
LHRVELTGIEFPTAVIQQCQMFWVLRTTDRFKEFLISWRTANVLRWAPASTPDRHYSEIGRLKMELDWLQKNSGISVP